jgi:hypothetical protein
MGSVRWETPVRGRHKSREECLGELFKHFSPTSCSKGVEPGEYIHSKGRAVFLMFQQKA